MATQAERLKALEKVRAGARIGGKGSMRRKVKNVHKKGSDEKKLQATLKRLQVNNIPGIEEINMFRDDGTVIHFVNPRRMSPSSPPFTRGRALPRLSLCCCSSISPPCSVICFLLSLVQASIGANTYVISGNAQVKSTYSSFCLREREREPALINHRCFSYFVHDRAPGSPPQHPQPS